MRLINEVEPETIDTVRVCVREREKMKIVHEEALFISTKSNVLYRREEGREKRGEEKENKKGDRSIDDITRTRVIRGENII